jgi:MOSC domain-containing protein YiiM
MAQVIAVCASQCRSDPKTAVGRGELRAGYGLVGDAHAGYSEREISLLGIESIEEVNREHHIAAVPGSFAENLTVAGLDLLTLKLGDQLQVGAALLEVVQLGKPADVAHTYNYRGVSVLPRKGVFCRVLVGGWVAPGEAIEVVRREGR